MEPGRLEVIGAGLFFFLIYLTGFGLRRSGKPYGVILFNIHKLLGLAAVVFLAIIAYHFQQVAPLDSLEIIASAVTFFLFAVTITSGGLLNIERPMPALVLAIHKLLPYLTTLSTAITLYLILSVP